MTIIFHSIIIKEVIENVANSVVVACNAPDDVDRQQCSSFDTDREEKEEKKVIRNSPSDSFPEHNLLKSTF